MDAIRREIEEAYRFISSRVKEKPRVGIILGTGLGRLAERITSSLAIPYSEICHFPSCTVVGHEGCLFFGRLAGQNVVVMQGRAHLYEGVPLTRIALPVRVMRRLGVEILIISNAAGGLNPDYFPGDLMVISDHINLTGSNPLTGPNLDDLGPRFPDMTAVYDKKLMEMAEKAALAERIKLKKGVYAGVAGPSMETPAETRFLRQIGADAVGMSTVPEAIVAVHCGLRILGFSAISNVNRPECMEPAPLEEVLKNAAFAGEKMIRIVEGVLRNL